MHKICRRVSSKNDNRRHTGKGHLVSDNFVVKRLLILKSISILEYI